MNHTETMTISELSQVTGTPASTIRFYLREGILPEPERRGKTRAYYGSTHVKRLRDIRNMQETSKLSIRDIKERLADITDENETSPSPTLAPFDRKDDIINAAIDLFRSRGYDSTSLDDIVERAKIGKGSFYLHFPGKKELFLECADRVFLDIDRKFQKELGNARDILERFKLRAALFVRTSRHFIDMLHIARGAFSSTSPHHRTKLRRIMQNIINPLIRDLDEGVRQGLLKDINTTVVAHMLWGGVEYGIYYLHDKSDAEIDSWLDRTFSLALKGIYTDPESGTPRGGKDHQ